MSCRTAGGNNTPEKLWNFIMEKKHASGEVPKKRWEPWLRRDTRNVPIIEKTTSKGYFINDLENFDAAFFGISPKEAELMDPHQRLALELSWEALENAGLDPKALAGSDTGVFMGVDSDDYSRLIMEDLPNVEAWSGVGTAYHGIPNRISYHLDLMGPSTAVDAACASSLVAIHLAYQSIVLGESNVAICGGVNVLIAPVLTHMLQKAGALSPDGLCLSFDDDAHGYARGEGGAIVVLKRLASAIADNDNIIAVMKGSASAQDGKTNGIMAPNSKAQELVARQALKRAGDMDPSTIGYVEAHATSTKLGDPTEIGAIARVYGIGRPRDAPCMIGSLKPNVGHLEAAAGAIGFVKAALAVNKGMLAPQTLFQKHNSRIDWKESGLQVVQDSMPWPHSAGLRRAAVCCYGYGGSVSHAILEQAPRAYSESQSLNNLGTEVEPEDAMILVISSFQEKRLIGQASSLADWLDTEGRTVSLKSVASTLTQRRAAQDYRVSMVVSNHDDAIHTLRNFAKGHSGQWIINNRVFGTHVSKDAVWVFSGHGAQWPEMGKGLLKNRVFYDAIYSLENVIQAEAGFSTLSALECGDLGGSDKVQVLTYMVQYGLFELLKSKGIEPQAIIGHSVGEIAASVAAGCITPEEGAIVVSRRAKLYAQIQGRGGMALVHLPFSKVSAELEGRRDVVAAISSSPFSCVISGESVALEQYISALSERNVKAFKVKTDIAFHSPMLEELVDSLRETLAYMLSPRPATIPIYSTSNIDPRTEVLRDSEYWTHNMVAPVRLHEAVETAIDDGMRIFVEVATHPIVSHSISETFTARGLDESATFGIMKRDTPAERSILHAISQLHTFGAPVDFATQLGTSSWATSVPGTPWVQKPYWKEVETGSISVSKQHDVDKHTLLGPCTEISGTNVRVFATILDDKSKPYPLTHLLDGTEIIPAAVYCNTFHHATGASVLNGLQLRTPTSMTLDQREIQVVVQNDSAQLSSRAKPSQVSVDTAPHSWTTHSCCKWNKQDMSEFQKTYDIDTVKSRIGTRLPEGFAWDFLQKIGVSGIAYPWAVQEHYGNDEEMIVKMDMDLGSQSITWDLRSWAPFLDAATSVGSCIFYKSPKMRIVSGIDQVQFVSNSPPPKAGYLYIKNANDENGLAAHISVLSEEGELLVKLQSMRFSDVEATSDRTKGVDSLFHQLAWIPPVFSEESLSLEHILLISDDDGVSKMYADQLKVHTQSLAQVASVNEFDQTAVQDILNQKNAIVLYVPGHINTVTEVPEKSHTFTWEAVSIIKQLTALNSTPKLFIITNNVQEGASPTSLAQAPLIGFGRIAAQEYPELWGGLIDNEGTNFPLLAIKYVRDQDIIQMQDGLPRIARLRPFAKNQRYETGSTKTLLPKPEGTYVVTGGFGDLGLEILDFLVAKGARRIVVVSRRNLPPRRAWHHTTQMKPVVDKIQLLESKGASIYGIALDIGAPNASTALLTALDTLSLPPVLGVVHAAGLSEISLIKDTTSDTFARVFNSKVAGGLALHTAFPPNTVDFFLLFSSIGQLVGTSGQSPYGAANAFLDTLAVHRRQLGDNAVAFQWTAWRAMGIANLGEFLAFELASKGITDITVEEGFRAWEEVARYDTAHAVVTRTRILDADEPVPIPLVADVVQRRARTKSTSTSSSDASISVTSENERPTGVALKPYVLSQIKNCLSTVLHLGVEEIDDRAAIADLGVDSVMSVALRLEMQKQLGIKAPPSLLWKEDTVKRLVDWVCGQLEEKE
jgi:6-methylsalicylic acid synthase